MTTLIILIVLLLVGISLKVWSYHYDEIGFVSCIVFGFFLFIHILYFSIASYEYGLFKQKRNAFQQTLNSARESNNQYETAAIIKDVVQWNIDLAEQKFNNKTLFFDQYIDDRIELLEPIK